MRKEFKLLIVIIIVFIIISMDIFTDHLFAHIPGIIVNGNLTTFGLIIQCILITLVYIIAYVMIPDDNKNITTTTNTNTTTINTSDAINNALEQLDNQKNNNISDDYLNSVLID